MYRILPFYLRHVMVAVTLLMVSPVAFAYICDKDAIGPLSVTIDKIEKVTQFDTPYNVKVAFQNDSDAVISVAITAESIEQVTVSPAESALTVPAKGTAETILQVQCAAGAYNAHYPVHVFAKFEWEGEKHVLHPVQVFETDFGAAGTAKKPVGKTQYGNDVFTGAMVTDAAQLPLIVLPSVGGIALTETDAYRVTWQQDRDRVATILNIGWQGNDPRSNTHFSKILMTRGGVSRRSLSIHPPYLGGPGTMFTEYLVQLPDTGGIQANTPSNTAPITFSSYIAIRDIVAPEPESDGVTFAVWVATGDFADGGVKVGEKHTASKTWEPFEVDLSQFAGQTVLLRLQSDPGPRRDTTCDSAFWGTPLLHVGEAPKLLTAEEKAELFAENLRALQTGRSENMRTVVFELKDDMRAAVTKGNYAFLDG
ncbi:MAG: hypothetical protein FWD31_13430, partial [Planctomycetaceae bacterium]|nr:hypothetical protein [Planctomycetaceae bacterium]